MGWVHFKGKDSRDFGILISAAPEKVRAERRVEQVTIPGRSGELTMDEGTYAPYVLLSIFAGGHKEINRTNLTCSDIAAGMKKPIVQKQIELLRMRNQFSVFSANAKIVAEVNGTKMDIRWQFGSEEAVLQTDFGDYSFSVSVRDTSSDTEYFKYDS